MIKLCPSHLHQKEMQAAHKIKAAALRFINPYADHFINESHPCRIFLIYLNGKCYLDYPELLRKCVEVTMDISDDHITEWNSPQEIKLVDQDLSDILLAKLACLKVMQHSTQMLKLECQEV